MIFNAFCAYRLQPRTWLADEQIVITHWREMDSGLTGRRTLTMSRFKLRFE